MQPTSSSFHKWARGFSTECKDTSGTCNQPVNKLGDLSDTICQQAIMQLCLFWNPGEGVGDSKCSPQTIPRGSAECAVQKLITPVLIVTVSHRTFSIQFRCLSGSIFSLCLTIVNIISYATTFFNSMYVLTFSVVYYEHWLPPGQHKQCLGKQPGRDRHRLVVAEEVPRWRSQSNFDHWTLLQWSTTPTPTLKSVQDIRASC